jgi:hypothetical protein
MELLGCYGITVIIIWGAAFGLLLESIQELGTKEHRTAEEVKEGIRFGFLFAVGSMFWPIIVPAALIFIAGYSFWLWFQGFMSGMRKLWAEC